MPSKIEKLRGPEYLLYIKDLESTLEIAKEALDDIDEDGDIYMNAQWFRIMVECTNRWKNITRQVWEDDQ